MPWQTIRGHDQIVERFRRALVAGRLASTFLFVGPAGIGKRAFALQLAQGLLCDRVPEQQLDPCGQCTSCRQVLAGSHPDVHRVSRPGDKSFIPLKLLIGEDETRMREGLCYELGAKPYSGRRKVAIIDDADYLNKEGANCLLKTLEEPPPKSVLILIGTSPQRQIPTIRSRCQVVRFQPLPPSDVNHILIEHGWCEDSAAAQQAADQSEGSIEKARLWCDAQVVEFRRELLGLLSRPETNLVEGSRLISQFADEAGKDSASKRQRLRLAVSLAEKFYRALLLHFTTGKSPPDSEVADALKTGRAWIAGQDAAAACLDVCLDAYAYIDANVNQAAFIDWWLDELASAAAAGSVAL
jgi:DNA polymerase III subunit delta'